MNHGFRYLKNENLWRLDVDNLEVYISGNSDNPDRDLLSVCSSILTKKEDIKTEGSKYFSTFGQGDEELWFCDAFEIRKDESALPFLEAQYSRDDDTYGLWTVRFRPDQHNAMRPFFFGRQQI